MRKNRNVRYLTREGIKNIATNRLMSVASIAVLMSCLVLIGSAVLIFLNVDVLLQNIEDQNVIMAFVELESDDAVVQKAKQDIEALNNIASCQYISKEAAFNMVIDSLGENSAIIDGEANTFLPDGFKITVADMNFFKTTVDQIKAIDNISSVQQNSDLATRLEEIRTAVTYVCFGIIILLFIVSLFIIANTVKVTMYTRKLEISIMKAVGATNWFIRWPFLIEGVFIGIISALISMVVLFLIYTLVSDSLLSIFGILGNGLVNFWDYALYLFGGFIIISVITGGLGSIISIGKYLKEQGSVVLDEN